MSDNKKNKRGLHLADLKKLEAEQTAKKLTKALDRFENGKLERLKEGTKLTRLNLATEAGVAKDTPFSRYREGHPQAHTYRFPEIVERFNRLRKNGRPEPQPEPNPDTVAELKDTISELRGALSASRCVANALDAQNVELKRSNSELEELASRLSDEKDEIMAELTKLRRLGISEVTTITAKK